MASINFRVRQKISAETIGMLDLVFLLRSVQYTYSVSEYLFQVEARTHVSEIQQ